MKYKTLDAMVKDGEMERSFQMNGLPRYKMGKIEIKQKRDEWTGKLSWEVYQGIWLLGCGLTKKDATLMLKAILEGKNFWEYK